MTISSLVLLILLILFIEGAASVVRQRTCTHIEPVVCPKYGRCCKATQFCHKSGTCSDCFPEGIRERVDRLKFCRELDRKTAKQTMRHQTCGAACTTLFTTREITACETTHYGVDCSLKCSDACYKQECDSVNGRCFKCIPGRRGDFCLLDCESGYYGEICSQRCNSDCADNKCNSTNGHCLECRPGKTGHFCTENCSPGTFGNGCQSNCSLSCAKDGLCHPVNGTCYDGCVAGFKGDLCNIAIPNDVASFTGYSMNSNTTNATAPYLRHSALEDKNAVIIGLSTAIFIVGSSVLVWYLRRRLKDKYEKIVTPVHLSRDQTPGVNEITDEAIYDSVEDGYHQTSDHPGIIREVDVDDHDDVIDQEPLSLESCDVTVHPPYLPPRPVQQQYIELGLVPIERTENNLQDVLIHAEEGNGVCASQETDANIDGDRPTTLPATTPSVVNTVQDNDTSLPTHIKTGTTLLNHAGIVNIESGEEMVHSIQNDTETTVEHVNLYNSPISCDVSIDEHHYDSLKHPRRLSLDVVNRVNNNEYITPSRSVVYIDRPAFNCVRSRSGMEYVDNQLSEVSNDDLDISCGLDDNYLDPVEGNVMYDCIIGNNVENGHSDSFNVWYPVGLNVQRGSTDIDNMHNSSCDSNTPYLLLSSKLDTERGVINCNQPQACLNSTTDSEDRTNQTEESFYQTL